MRSTVLTCLALHAAAVAWACASPASSKSDRDTRSDAKDASAQGGPDNELDAAAPLLLVLPARGYSGVDGMHTFQVPFSVHGAKGIVPEPSDPSALTITRAHTTDPANADDGDVYLVTAKKPGTFTITVRDAGRTATATLTVTTYTPDRWFAGEQRYKADASSGPACISCHFEDGGIDHSPTALAAATDDDIATVITTGILVEGNPILAVRHKWQVSDTERDGLITYLRALPPRGFAPQ